MSTRNDIQKGLENELQALQAIHRFGWLRPQEIGRYIWPGSKHSEVYGVRIGLKLQKSEMVISRKLPRHCGTALVLSKRGAARLREVGINAFSGKDIGMSVGDAWIPRKSWEHDLLCSSILILASEKFHYKNFKFYSEREIINSYPSAIKVPDGFIYNDAGSALWVEVENTKKSGHHIVKMVRNAINVSRYGEELFGKNCKNVVFAYPEFSEDNRGFKVNHRMHLINAIKPLLEPGFNMEVTLFKIKQKSGAAVSIDVEVLVLESDVTRKKARNLMEIDSDEETGAVYFQTDLQFHTGWIEPYGEEYNWSIYLDRQSHDVPDNVQEFHETGLASSLTEAKIAIVNAVEKIKIALKN
jgi:hypothetical protein